RGVGLLCNQEQTEWRRDRGSRRPGVAGSGARCHVARELQPRTTVAVLRGPCRFGLLLHHEQAQWICYRYPGCFNQGGSTAGPVSAEDIGNRQPALAGGRRKLPEDLRFGGCAGRGAWQQLELPDEQLRQPDRCVADGERYAKYRRERRIRVPGERVLVE